MRRDLNELAAMLFPDPADVVREGLGGILPPTYEGGVALADSEGGTVRVLPDGTVTTWADGDPDGTAEDAADPDAEAAEPVTVPCTANVREGDRVLLVVQDGAYVDCMAAGSGDRVAATASQAEAIATATQQHFWSDSNGIHVSTDEGDPEGTNNILINSLGILLRELTTVLLELSSAGVIVGDQSGTHLAVDSDSVDIMGIVNSVVALLMSLGYDATHSMAYLVSSRPIALQSNVGGGFYDSSTLAQTFIEANSTAQVAKLEATDGTYQAGVDASVTSGEPVASIGMTKGTKSASVGVMNGNVFIDCTSKIYTNMEAPIVYEDKSYTIPSTAAGSNYSSSAISVLKTGYAPVACVQTWFTSGTNQNRLNDYGTHVEAGNLYIRLHNYGTSAASGTLKCRILYFRTELL